MSSENNRMVFNKNFIANAVTQDALRTSVLRPNPGSISNKAWQVEYFLLLLLLLKLTTLQIKIKQKHL